MKEMWRNYDETELEIFPSLRALEEARNFSTSIYFFIFPTYSVIFPTYSFIFPRIPSYFHVFLHISHIPSIYFPPRTWILHYEPPPGSVREGEANVDFAPGPRKMYFLTSSMSLRSPPSLETLTRGLIRDLCITTPSLSPLEIKT